MKFLNAEEQTTDFKTFDQIRRDIQYWITKIIHY